MTAPAVTPDLTLSDDLPCRDCGCPAHTSRQSRLASDWGLCNAHEYGDHGAGLCAAGRETA